MQHDSLSINLCFAHPLNEVFARKRSKQKPVSEVSDFPILLAILYLFVLVVWLLIVSVSALILLNAYGKKIEPQAWIFSGRYSVAASLVTTACFWRRSPGCSA